MNKIKAILGRLPAELDYQSLMAELPPVSHPRRKIKELQDKNLIVRLKKGFYVITEKATGRAYSLPIAANLLYGPSYLSLEYGLGIHGLIPERVEELTSVTTQKNKVFETPVGRFSYHHLQPNLYFEGVSVQKSHDGRSFLLGTPEKVLLDIFTLRFKSSDRPTKDDLLSALNNDLRIDMDSSEIAIDRDFLLRVRPKYKNRPWCRLLINFLLEDK